jgi:hypothetical protein
LIHAHAIVDIDRDPIITAFTNGKGDWPSVVVEKITQFGLFTFCKPLFLVNDELLKNMNNLKYYRLLRDSMFECWNKWLKLAGVKDTPSNKGIIINDINVAILAGVGG